MIKQKNIFLNYAIMSLGVLIMVLSLKTFIIPHGMSTGGVSGIALVISQLLPISLAAIVWIFNITMLLMILIFVGKDIFFKAIYGSLLFSFFITVIPTFHIMNNDALLAMIIGGGCIGVGVSLVFSTGGSTGGTSLPPYILNKYFKLSLTTGFFLCDVIAVGMNLLIGDTMGIFYGVICILSTKIVADYVQSGLNRRKSVHIISNHYEEITTFIHDHIKRGTTLVQAQGGFTKHDKPIILTVVSTKEFYQIRDYALSIDSDAFIIIGTVSEVYGVGFTGAKKELEDTKDLDYLEPM